MQNTKNTKNSANKSQTIQNSESFVVDAQKKVNHFEDAPKTQTTPSPTVEITGKKIPSLLKKKKNRIWELDFLRGICVLLMIWDHFMFSVMEFFGEAWAEQSQGLANFVSFAGNYWTGNLRTFFHPIIFCLFFLMCGISCSLSRNNLKRGIIALFLAFGITAVTSMFETIIRFGVLHMLAFAIIFYWIINTLCNKNKKITSLVCLIVGVVIIIANEVFTYEMPPETLNPELAFIGDFLGGSMYESMDYFPLIPYVGYMFLGASVGGYLYGEKKSLFPSLDKYGWHKPISFWGNKALIVYILHQPIIIGILSFISYCFITPGDWIFF